KLKGKIKEKNGGPSTPLRDRKRVGKKANESSVSDFFLISLSLSSETNVENLYPQNSHSPSAREMSKEHPPEPLDFFIWTVEDVGLWLEEINLGSYRQTFKENGVNGEYLEGMSMFTTEQILRFIRRCHMKWGDFITLCKELRRIKVACLKGEQKVRRPWWAPSCLSVVFVKVAKRNRQSRSVKLHNHDEAIKFLLQIIQPMFIKLLFPLKILEVGGDRGSRNVTKGASLS
ncbi:Sterile alpha motif domain-containing protein, partial [Prunus dulcis]